MNQITRIITHSGKFHSDELIACAIIRLFNGMAPVVRTREITTAMLEDPSIAVVDVGGVYAPESSNFDHHQTGAPVRADGRPYSSAGLVWAALRPSGKGEAAWETVDRKMTVIDASDNGMGPALDPERISFQEVISTFNTSWLEDPADVDDAFASALVVVTQVLRRWLAQAEASAQATEMVEEACIADPTILRLPRPMPWHETFFAQSGRTHQFVIFKGGEGDWRLQCIPPTMEESFKQRTPLPEAWAGLRDTALEKVSGVAGTVFCHKGRFIAGATSEDAIEEMARLALAQ